jgi:tRNA pseudouridine38-40 synthase
VHAIAQVAHVRTHLKRSFPPPHEILRALNERLPSDVCILDVEEESDKFHARHDAVARTYLYQISTRRTAFFKKYVWWVREPLDIPLMSRAARMLAGRHNFVCFRAPDPSRPDESTIVVVDDAAIEEDGHLILFRITGSHFLWRMVRRIVGVLVKVGKGEITLDEFAGLLEGHADPRFDVAAWTAPASGLFLEKVEYPAERSRRASP